MQTTGENFAVYLLDVSIINDDIWGAPDGTV